MKFFNTQIDERINKIRVHNNVHNNLRSSKINDFLNHPHPNVLYSNSATVNCWPGSLVEVYWPGLLRLTLKSCTRVRISKLISRETNWRP